MLKDILFSALAVIVVVVDRRRPGPEGADRPARSRARRRESAARVAVPVAVRAAVAQPAGDRDVHHARLPGRRDRRAVAGAVRQQSRRAGAEPPAGRGAAR